jgi:hypothetical protein
MTGLQVAPFGDSFAPSACMAPTHSIAPAATEFNHQVEYVAFIYFCQTHGATTLLKPT